MGCTRAPRSARTYSKVSLLSLWKPLAIEPVTSRSEVQLHLKFRDGISCIQKLCSVLSIHFFPNAYIIFLKNTFININKIQCHLFVSGCHLQVLRIFQESGRGVVCATKELLF